MLKKITILSLILLSCTEAIFAQHPNDTINLKKINYPYIEYLLKKQIDSIRTANGLLPLMNDSALFIASLHHVGYLSDEKTLVHEQYRKIKTETPQKRAEAFGGDNYSVGENLGIIHLHTASYYEHIGEESEHFIYTYGQAAKDFMLNWINDPESMGNILTASYKITGLAIMLEPNSNVLRVVQDFAAIPDGYFPSQIPDLFPYSMNDDEWLIEMYKKIPVIKKHKKHAWKLKPAENRENILNVKRKLETIRQVKIFRTSKLASLYFSDDAAAKWLFSEKNDGVAAELVPTDYYKCGNAQYYSYPARRNGRCIFNGAVLTPVYSEQLFSDDNNELAKTKTGDITLDLGKLPEFAKKGEYEVNALIIKNGELCNIIVPPSYCSRFMEYIPDTLPYFDNWANNKYVPQLKRDTLKLKVFYERASAQGKTEDLKPYFDFLKRKNYIIASAEIEAYASIEGSPEINKKLFTQRAENFLKAFRDRQESDIEISVVTRENWEMFFEQIKNTDFAFLADIDTTEIRAFVNSPENLSILNHLLDKQRYAYVNLIAVPFLTEKNIHSYARMEYRTILDTINYLFSKQLENQKIYEQFIKRLENVQLFLYNSYFLGKIPFNLAKNLSFPEREEFGSMLLNKLLLKFKATDQGESINETELFNELLKLKKYKGLPAMYWYTLLTLVVNNCYDSYFTDAVSAKDMNNMLTAIEKSGIDIKLINKLKLFYHFRNAGNYYKEGNFTRAKLSLRFIASYYSSYKDTLKVIEAALNMLEFQQKNMAMEVLEPLALSNNPNHDALILYLKLFYEDYSVERTSDFYYLLYDAAHTLADKEWCELFGGECNIGLQIFDYEPLWKMFCIKCNNK
ncbi:MAG: hypothetical protein HY738_17155 [Bacteroidia bacterium]|nr:hypothetical protein [Bacteroidia bacterium]